MKNSIFRQEALQRYRRGREESVLPRFVSPPTFAFLWGGLIVLMAAASFAWSVRIPVRVAGTAVFVQNPSTPQNEIVLATFWPPENLQRLRPGQMVFLQADGGLTRVQFPIVKIEPEVLGPADLALRFSRAVNVPLTQPVAVAFALIEDWPHDASADRYLGSVYLAEVEVGTQRLISLLPLVGAWFE